MNVPLRAACLVSMHFAILGLSMTSFFMSFATLNDTYGDHGRSQIQDELEMQFQTKDAPKLDRNTRLVEGENHVAQATINGTTVYRCACYLSWSRAPI